MGLTSRSTGAGIVRSAGVVRDATRRELVVALAGNPNTGKSTVFNGLTGLRQHTGNWPGKTVTVAGGRYTYGGNVFLLVDLPGTYSLLTRSAEEEVARDLLLSGRPDATVVVADATCLERNLNLALQVIEITPRTVLCVNLIDEARRGGISVDVPGLERALGIPVVATAARSGVGLDDLKKAIAGVATGRIRPEPVPVPYSSRIQQAARLLAPALLGMGFDERRARWLAMSLIGSSGATRDSLLRFIAGRSAAGTGTGG